MDIRKIIREEIKDVFFLYDENTVYKQYNLFEAKSQSFYSKLRDLMAPDGKLLKYFKTKKIKDWPLVPSSDGDENEKGTLDLENNEFISLDKNKLILVTGGDWQDPWIVEIGNASGGLKVIKCVPAKDGEYKKLTKKGNRMSSEEITKEMFSDHPMNKSIDEYIKEIKSSIKSYYPLDNSYGDEIYEEEIIEGPNFNKNESEVYIIWKVGGYDKYLNQVHTDVNDKEKSHEEYVLEDFEKWTNERFWYGEDGKFNIKNKNYKLKCGIKSLGNDNVKYFIKIKEI